MRFEFGTATQIIFGGGSITEAARLTRPWGKRAFVITGRDTARAKPLVQGLEKEGISFELFPVGGEPTAEVVSSALRRARAFKTECVIGFGGGSALDTAKAVAGLLTNPGDLMDYLEVVGRGQPLTHAAAPWMAIPTTSGTGSEVTRNAVIGIPDQGVKVSLRSPFLLAKVALIDPQLTLGLAPAVTAATGMDALTQLIEAYVCVRANPMTDALCSAGIVRVARALPKVWRDPSDESARSDMALGSLWSGIALANAGLGAVHGFAAPIGGMFDAPHGAVCAALLGPVMEANLRVLKAGPNDQGAIVRFTDIARWLTGCSTARPEDGVSWVKHLAAELKIPPLSAYGISEADFPSIITRTQAASSFKANPAGLSPSDLYSVIRAAR